MCLILAARWPIGQTLGQNIIDTPYEIAPVAPKMAPKIPKMAPMIF